jgi:hypothetical protein
MPLIRDRTATSPAPGGGLETLASFCREWQFSRENCGFCDNSCAILLDLNVCIMTHIGYETCCFRVCRRCRALVAECIGGSLACGSWVAELAAQSVHPRELPGLSVRRTASKLCAVWSREGTSCCGLRAGRACAGGAAQSGQWAGATGSAAPGGTALYQGAEARARGVDEERRELIGVEDSGATDQFCRLGIDASGPAS